MASPTTPSSVTSSSSNNQRHIEVILQDKAKEIHAALFSTSPDHKRRTIELHYSPLCTFDDPLVSVQGHRAILSQFMFLTLFPTLRSRIDLIHVHHDLISNTFLVVIESRLSFSILPWNLLSVPIRCFTRLKFGCVDDHEEEPLVKKRRGSITGGKEEAKWLVLSHEDVWSIRDTIAEFLFTGWIYETWRKWNGSVSSAVLEWGV
ncbi:hypothetical protein BC829DRAFT_383474 [Chytridium lagenaria]|nr:hypothetical protein BC829DRAFT_383474 [Chytridium lagenaria]